MSWTDERIQELTSLWQAGHSASEIGKRLGVSKNAVVGKAHRLGLPSRPSPIKQGEAKVAKTAAQPRKAVEAPSAAQPAAPNEPEPAQPATAQADPARTDTARTAAARTVKAEPEAGSVSRESPAASPASVQQPAKTTASQAAPAMPADSAPASAEPAPSPAKAAASAPAKPTAKESGSKAKSSRSLKSVGGKRGGGREHMESRGLRSGCLWPFGDPGDADFHFCGADCVAGKPYCAEHAARAYITRSRDRDEEAA